MYAPVRLAVEEGTPRVTEEPPLDDPLPRSAAVEAAFDALLGALQRDEGALGDAVPEWLGDWAGRFEQAIRKRVEHGVAGAQLVLQSAAPRAARAIVKLAKHAANEKVQLSAAEAVMKHAGVTPMKAEPAKGPDQLLLVMTEEELRMVWERGLWPERLAHQVQRQAVLAGKMLPGQVVEVGAGDYRVEEPVAEEDSK